MEHEANSDADGSILDYFRVPEEAYESLERTNWLVIRVMYYCFLGRDGGCMSPNAQAALSRALGIGRNRLQ